jgi:F-type H+-transporting ATPase subunit b
MTGHMFAAQEGGDNFLVPNGTFIVELVIFLIILGVVWKYVVPPVKKAMTERQEMIRRQIEESRKTRERLEAADAKYREVLSEARTEAAKIRDEARAEAGRIKAELREQAEREVEQIRQRGEEQLATQREQVVRQLRSEIGELAVTLAGRIIGESMQDEARRQDTVDRFIGELEAMSATDDADEGGAREPASRGRGARSRAGGRGRTS